MQPFKLKAACRMESELKVWDSARGQWTTHKLPKPRLVQNPPQAFTAEQTTYLAEYAKLLAESIRLDTEYKRAQDKREKDGPLEYLYMHYKLLEREGFTAIEDQPAIKQLTAYAWDLVDRYNAKRLSWADFEDQVERWYLLLSDKLAARRGPVKVGA